MGLVMIDITKITLVLYTDMTIGRDTLDVVKEYNAKFWAHKVQHMCKVTCDQWDFVRIFGSQM